MKKVTTCNSLDNGGRHAAGIIVGSALVEVLEKGEAPAVFLESSR